MIVLLHLHTAKNNYTKEKLPGPKIVLRIRNVKGLGKGSDPQQLQGL